MTCIVVLGCHRSGTSLVAGILHQAGVRTGTRVREPDKWNPTGYWEDLDWRDLNKKLLNSARGTWYRPPSPQAIAAQANKLADEIRTLVERKDTAPLWGFKDPRTCLTIEALMPYLPEDTRFLIVHRDQEKVINSLMRRAQGRGYYEPSAHWRALVNEYYRRMGNFTDTYMGYTLRVTYESLVDRGMCGQVSRWLAWLCGLNAMCVEQAMERIVRWNTVKQ